MHSFILAFDPPVAPLPDPVLRVAVKDIMDLAGTPTTAGSRAVADRAVPAERDAACLAGIRAAERAGKARVVGKTNLHELAFGVSGVNRWYGTPTNPLDPRWVPGGSSSGSATAVGSDEADVAVGTDTGGSIRIPAACCGVVGLKTTWGRIPLGGVRPLAPSLDTVGAMGRDVASVVEGMALLEPGFAPAPLAGTVEVGRVRLPAHPAIDRALDQALAGAGFSVREVALPGWDAADEAAHTILLAEAWAANGALAWEHPGELGADVERRLTAGASLQAKTVLAARAAGGRWRTELAAALRDLDVLAWPSLAEPPPAIPDGGRVAEIRYSLPVNLAGVPAISLPVPMPGPWPASLHLVGSAGSDALLVSVAALVEGAVN
ncbi:MAG: amidase [Acidimicrobiales bacterium]